MDSLFALSANSKEAMEVWQRRGHHVKKTYRRGGGHTYISAMCRALASI